MYTVEDFKTIDKKSKGLIASLLILYYTTGVVYSFIDAQEKDIFIYITLLFWVSLCIIKVFTFIFLKAASIKIKRSFYNEEINDKVTFQENINKMFKLQKIKKYTNITYPILYIILTFFNILFLSK